MSALTCPIPLDRYPFVTLAHGGGGRLMGQLIRDLFVATLGGDELRRGHDAGVIRPGSPRLAFTTDGFVVDPLLFPGGDIGSLAVNGTVNDLAMAGARPRWLSLGCILEEGLPMETLWQVVRSIRAAADAAGVEIVTGDTKVVERGRGHGIYLTTAGVGEVEADGLLGPGEARDGDVILISGDPGRHGIAVLSQREGLGFEAEVVSDCAPVHEATLALIRQGIPLRCLRDPTRGGLAAVLHEIAGASGVTASLTEAVIPLHPAVRGACELLGLNPLRVASEGRFVAILPEEAAASAVTLLRGLPGCPDPAVIGRIRPRGIAPVVLTTPLGIDRIVDLPAGEELPRIC